MSWIDPPEGYETQPGDQIMIRLAVGYVQPPISWIQTALDYNGKYRLDSGAYEGGDLVLYLTVLPPPDGPEIIEAGLHPGIIIAILAVAGLGLATLLLKDFKIRAPGGVSIDWSSSGTGLTLVLLAAAGLYLFTATRK